MICLYSTGVLFKYWLLPVTKQQPVVRLAFKVVQLEFLLILSLFMMFMMVMVTMKIVIMMMTMLIMTIMKTNSPADEPTL